MRSCLAFLTAVLSATLLIPSGPVEAVTINLQLVDRFELGSSRPLGLAFDGTNLWYAERNTNRLVEISTAGVLTGNAMTNPLTGSVGATALAWDDVNMQLVSANGTGVRFFDRYTAANQRSVTLSGVNQGNGLIDGLDFDHNEIWYSPDIYNIYRLTSTGALTGTVNPIPIPPGTGFSGVERVDVGSESFLAVVNDNFFPRKLTIASLAGVEIGSVTIQNSRYEDLAFDGRYLYAADVDANRIDKLDVLVDGGGSIFEPLPEPASMALLCLGALGIVVYSLNRRRQAFA